MNKTKVAKAVVLGLASSMSLSAVATAESTPSVTLTEASTIEVIKIQSKKAVPDLATIDSPSRLVTANQTDVGQWLNSLAGAAGVNNGPVTTLAQYRGYTGDRVGVAINNQAVVGAGPNSMD